MHGVLLASYQFVILQLFLTTIELGTCRVLINTFSTVPVSYLILRLDLDAKIPAISQETCNNGVYSSQITYLDAAKILLLSIVERVGC